MRLNLLLIVCVVSACSRASTESTADAPPTIALAPAASAAPAGPRRIAHFPGRGTLRIADRAQSPTIALELARKDGERQQGLMFRQSMADDHGMLFFMPYDNEWVFYMRNTYIPLDMVFIDSDWRVVGVVENVPPLTEDHRSVEGNSRYVLELTAHTAGKLGIRAGTRLIYDALPDAPPQGP